MYNQASIYKGESIYKTGGRRAGGRLVDLEIETAGVIDSQYYTIM